MRDGYLSVRKPISNYNRYSEIQASSNTVFQAGGNPSSGKKISSTLVPSGNGSEKPKEYGGRVDSSYRGCATHGEEGGVKENSGISLVKLMGDKDGS